MAELNEYQTIVRPITTEKSLAATAQGKYTFEVDVRANKLQVAEAVSFIFPLPLAYKDQIAKIPGVEAVTYANWFQGVYIDKNQFFARLAVDPETIFEVYPEFVVSKDEYQTFLKERNSCIIGQDIAVGGEDHTRSPALVASSRIIIHMVNADIHDSRAHAIHHTGDGTRIGIHDMDIMVLFLLVFEPMVPIMLSCIVDTKHINPPCHKKYFI